MVISQNLEAAVQSRIAAAEMQIKNSLASIREGNPLGSEWDTTRLINRLQTKALLSQDEAKAVALGIRAFAVVGAVETMTGLAPLPERIYGNTMDFVSVSFLERGMKAAQAVARVAFLNGAPQGSGFMVSDRLFLTNNHVISSKEMASSLCVEFDYELDPADRMKGITRFSFDSETFFLTDDENDLDYTLIAIGNRLAGPKNLQQFGYCQLSGAKDKHALGEVANIVQHPQGRYKEVVLRENRLVSRLDTVLHYVADTEPGSSGSPVFNNEWRVIALHHWGGPWRQKVDDQGRPLPGEINEGIRASAIVNELTEKAAGMGASQRALLVRAIELDESASGRAPVVVSDATAHDEASPAAEIDADGRVTWRIPIEISVRLPHVMIETSNQNTQPSIPAVPIATTSTSEATLKPSKDYSNRSGYKPRFIAGHTVDLPLLRPAIANDAALNQQAEPGDDPHELKYHHFSIVMNKRRKFAFFTACNIDGANAKKVDRKTGTVSVLRPDDAGLESMAESGAEATEKWYPDGRLLDGDYTNQSLYDQQQVPGFPNPRSAGRLDRMLQRGHMVRRMDPAWGTNKQALVADADTFHFTNCVPQLGFFNMGTAQKLNLPGTGGGTLWRALENHVLRNAVVEKKRICSFTGPVFDDDNDPNYRDIKVPMKFWKIVVWADDGALRSLAMIADQKPVLDAIKGLPEAVTDAEAFDELDKVEDFLSTIADIESLTKIDFGNAIRAADIRRGESLQQIRNFSDIPIVLDAAPKARGRVKVPS